MNRPSRIRLAWLLALMMALTAVPSSATSENVGGDVNNDGSLVMYATIRTHVNAGNINMNLQDTPGTEYLRLGLRNHNNNTQFTLTEQFDSASQRDFRLASNGSNQIPAGKKFRINARKETGCVFFCDNHWGGVLNY